MVVRHLSVVRSQCVLGSTSVYNSLVVCGKTIRRQKTWRVKGKEKVSDLNQLQIGNKQKIIYKRERYTNVEMFHYKRA